MKKLILIPLICLVACACAPKPVDPVKDVVQYDKSDSKMNAAVAEAQRTLPDFIKRLPKLDPETSMVKWAAPLPDGGHEHIWVNHVVYKDGWFKGKLANEPDKIEGKKLGDKVRFKETDVSDWIVFTDDQHYEGGYTQKVMEEGELKGRM